MAEMRNMGTCSYSAILVKTWCCASFVTPYRTLDGRAGLVDVFCAFRAGAAATGTAVSASHAAGCGGAGGCGTGGAGGKSEDNGARGR